MAKAIVDPEKLRSFAGDLKRASDELENTLTLLQGRFSALGDTWQDQEHAKFAESFKQASAALAKFINESQQQVPLLMRKAKAIEDYLQMR